MSPADVFEARSSASFWIHWITLALIQSRSDRKHTTASVKREKETGFRQPLKFAELCKNVKYFVTYWGSHRPLLVSLQIETHTNPSWLHKLHSKLKEFVFVETDPDSVLCAPRVSWSGWCRRLCAVHSDSCRIFRCCHTPSALTCHTAAKETGSSIEDYQKMVAAEILPAVFP